MRQERRVVRPGRPVYGRPAPERKGLPQISLPAGSVKLLWRVLAVLAILVLISSVTALKKVTITGNHAITSDRLQRLAITALENQWFGRNTLLINTSALGNYIKSNEAGINTAKITRHLPGTLEIMVTERQPSLNWKTGDQVYLLDSDGTVLGVSRGQYTKLPVVTDSVNLPVKVGDRVAPRQFISFCVQLAAQLPAVAKLQPKEMTVPQTTSELYVTFANASYLIKFDATRPPGDEIADLQKVLQQLRVLKKTPESYIDLRVEHKAYYK